MTNPTDPSIATLIDLGVFRKQLDRVPRGVVDIAVRCVCSRPLAVKIASRLEDGTLFPTTFYLTCPPIAKGYSVLEAEHIMESFNEPLTNDEDTAAAYPRVHRDYIARRDELGEVEKIAGVSTGGMPIRVERLYALVGHALAAGAGVNPIGDLALEMLAERGLWSRERCSCRVEFLLNADCRKGSVVLGAQWSCGTSSLVS